MDILFGIASSLVTIGFVIAVMVVLVCLFMIVFSFATSFDKRMQE